MPPTCTYNYQVYFYKFKASYIEKKTTCNNKRAGKSTCILKRRTNYSTKTKFTQRSTAKSRGAYDSGSGCSISSLEVPPNAGSNPMHSGKCRMRSRGASGDAYAEIISSYNNYKDNLQTALWPKFRCIGKHAEAFLPASGASRITLSL